MFVRKHRGMGGNGSAGVLPHVASLRQHGVADGDGDQVPIDSCFCPRNFRSFSMSLADGVCNAPIPNTEDNTKVPEVGALLPG